METPPISPAFKDRTVGLVIFGALTILIGCICALFVPLMFYGATLAPRAHGASVDFRMILPSMIIYGLLAIALVWLGIGSILRRRWARSILLLFSWAWLLVGIISVTASAIVIPRSMALAGGPQNPAMAQTVALVAVMIFLGFFFFLLPLCWLLFYRGRNVKATCEAHDPGPSWTDRCPLPVLALSLGLAFGAVTMLGMPYVYRGVFPFFGIIIAGWPGTAVYWALAIVWAYAALATYRLDVRGWWTVLVFMILFAVSAFITYSTHDILEIYRLMGLPPEQIAQIEAMPWLRGQSMAWMTLASSAVMIGYTLYTGRYFKRSTAEVQP